MPTKREFLHPTFVRTPIEGAAAAELDYPSTEVGRATNICVYYPDRVPRAEEGDSHGQE